MTQPISSFRDLKQSSYFSIKDVDERLLGKMLLAAKKGNCPEMETLLDQTTDLSQPKVQDALCLAAKYGQENIVDFLLQKGVSPTTTRKYDPLKDSWEERLTAMGNAIENRQTSVIDVLLKFGADINDVHRDTQFLKDKALDLFFSKHHHQKSNPSLLCLLLDKKAEVHGLKSETIFNIAIYSSTEELDLLIEAGFDPNTTYLKEKRPDLQEKNTFFYRSEISLLDLAIIQAERANLFQEDPDSMNKVMLLLKKEADVTSTRNRYGHNYLHKVSHPKLIELFCQNGVDPKAQVLLDKHKEIYIRPIDVAYSQEAVQLLCEAGEDISNSPLIKDTPAHQQALERIGFDPAKGADQLGDKGELFLRKAAQAYDIPAFIALIGAGIDVNQVQSTHSKQTVMHQLFAEMYLGSITFEIDYMNTVKYDKIRLINILIRHGALPSKDSLGRTPLMCLNLNPSHRGFNREIIKLYSGYEAAHHNLNPEDYEKKLFKLRDCGFQRNATHPCQITLEGKDTRVSPIKSAFDLFWKSFEDHSELNLEKQDHDSVQTWNRLREYFE